MSHTQVQLAQGNTSQVAGYTGPIGEVVVNTDDFSVIVQDGATAGGVSRIPAGSQWKFPGGAATYAATIADSAKVLSSYNSTGAALTVILPSPSALPNGWALAFVTDNGKGLVVETGGSGQNILIPGVGAVGSLALAPVNFEYLRIEYDGGGSDFRIVAATPATWSSIGGAAAGCNYSYQQPTTGATLTAAAYLAAYVIDPAGGLASLTVVTPPGASDGQLFEISTTQAISALTASPAAGQTVLGGALLLEANGGVGWRYRAANNTWYRRF
jgi:hypothetical protein